MLSCEDLTVTLPDGETKILKGANAYFESQAMNAVIGPSGCGKSTLVKAMLGILPAEGKVRLSGREIDPSEDLVGRVGYCPQFTCAHAKLTVEEAIRYSLRLCVIDAKIRDERLGHILDLIGLAEHSHKRVENLSGGQLRRLGLGLELTSDPGGLVCDEVTSGLDPASEDHILDLERELVNKEGKTFVNIIHNLGKLDRFDHITVVFQGDVIYQGTYKELLFYFGVEDPLNLYTALSQHDLAYWQQRWSEYAAGTDPSSVASQSQGPSKLPGAISQMMTVLSRRMLLFGRDRGYLLMTLAITIGFPCVVVIFALDGFDDLPGRALDKGGQGLIEQIQDQILATKAEFRLGSLVTGLVMFQVILLTLMGSNNGAREIAAERDLFEKERLNGLTPGAYATAKMLFAGMIALVQGVVMALIVHGVCGFPGSLVMQMGVLALCCISMSIICLGFSALSSTSEKASMLSIYLVGFQLPLSGIVLALPDYLTWFFRPFINAYWAWSGFISTMTESTEFKAVRNSNEDLYIALSEVAGMVLLIQLLVGAALVFWGCQRRAWN